MSSGEAETSAHAGKAPVDVARDLRWRVVRDVLLDPFAWVGGVLLGLVAARVGARLAEGVGAPWVVGVAALLGLLLGVGLADALLFRTPENDLLRTQPLGPDGLRQVRSAELGWWLSVPSLLGAAVGWGAAGVLGAVAAGGAAQCAVGASVVVAIHGRRAAGRTGSALAMTLVAALGVGLLLAGSVAPGSWSLPPWPVAAGLGVGMLALGRAARSTWAAHYEALASDAAAAPATARWSWATGLLRRLPLPPPLRARVARDAILLLRGQDGRGAALLLLSPAAALTLRFDPTPTAGQLLWQALTAAALGGGAIAYAVGPGIHRLRSQVLPWSRTAPGAGPRALIGGVLWGSFWALAHGAFILAVVATARGGWFAQELPSLILPVLALELAMAHFSVVFTLSRATDRGVNGEGMLAFALPAVAVGIALAGVLAPWAILLYPLATASMTGQAAQRLEHLEVAR